MALKPELSCLSTLSENLIDLEFDADLLGAAKSTIKENEIDLEVMKNVINNINGLKPFRFYRDEEETIKEKVDKITDFINFKGEYDPVTHNRYEMELYKDCPALYADRMKDLQYRWRWANPGLVTDPFANCGESAEFAVPKENIMGTDYKPIVYDRDKLSQMKVYINELDSTNLPWYTKESGAGIILAGGAVTSELHSAKFSDYDFFVIAKTEDEGREIIKKTIRVISEEMKKEELEYYSKVFICVKEHVINLSSNKYWPIQIITRLYESPAQVINGFDVDACCVGYCPESGIFMATRASRAFKNGWLMVDPMCQSPSYEHRLVKYAKRYNLGIYVPFYKNIHYDREPILFLGKNHDIKKKELHFYHFRPRILVYEKGLPLLNSLMNNNKYLFRSKYDYDRDSDYNRSRILKDSTDIKELDIDDIKINIIATNPQSQGKFLSGSFQPTYTYDFYKYYKSLKEQIKMEKNMLPDIKSYYERKNFLNFRDFKSRYYKNIGFIREYNQYSYTYYNWYIWKDHFKTIDTSNLIQPDWLKISDSDYDFFSSDSD